MTTTPNASDEEFPSVYASPTEWNESLISALSSMIFRRSHRPEFVRAAKERLMDSLEVQNPALVTNNAKPILLVFLTSDGDSSVLDCFRDAVEQSTAFMVIHQRIDPRQTTRRQYDNVASICKMSGLPTFLIMSSSCLDDEPSVQLDLNYFWNQLCSDSLAGPTNSCLKGIISISKFGTVQALERSCQIPHLKVALGSVRDQKSGNFDCHYSLTDQNPSVISLLLPACHSNTCCLWLARLLFKYVFAVLQLSKYENMMITGNPQPRL